jgi:glycosyltransferase involved in cell wall biosynthesis
MRRRLVDSLAATQLVFCQTHTVAERFRQRFQFSGQVAIMPNALSRFACPPSDGPPPIFSQLQGKTVLFCLTKFYPHKNLESLVEMFQRHSVRLRDVVVLLTITAAQHPHAGAFLRQLEAPTLRDRFINVGPLQQYELSGYYRHSSALILPTLLESFTATYLEAMQFDCPVLTSDLDFAREICGEAAIYFDPWNVDDMCEAVLRLRNDPALQQNLRLKGRERLMRVFPSWQEITAEALRTMTKLVDNTELPAAGSTRRVQESPL